MKDHELREYLLGSSSLRGLKLTSINRDFIYYEKLYTSIANMFVTDDHTQKNVFGVIEETLNSQNEKIKVINKTINSLLNHLKLEICNDDPQNKGTVQKINHRHIIK